MSRLLDALKNLQHSPETPAEKKIVPRLAASIRRAVLGKQDPVPTPAVWFRVPEATSQPAVEVMEKTVGMQAPPVAAKPLPVRTPDPVSLVDSISESIREVEREQPVVRQAAAPVAPPRPQPTSGESEIFAVLADAIRSEPYQQLIGAIARDTAARRLPVVAVLGIDERDSTSFVAAVVATLIAEQRECKVLLLEANARSGQLADRYGLGDAPGLSELLAGRTKQAAVKGTSHHHLDVLPFGQANAAQAKLLPAVLNEELAGLGTGYGATVLDGGPLASDWALAASQSADATYLLVRLNETSAEEATARVNRFRSSGGKLTGCIAIGQT